MGSPAPSFPLFLQRHLAGEKAWPRERLLIEVGMLTQQRNALGTLLATLSKHLY